MGRAASVYRQSVPQRSYVSLRNTEMHGRFDKVELSIDRLGRKFDHRFGALAGQIENLSNVTKDTRSILHRLEYQLKAQAFDDRRKEDLQTTRIAMFGVAVSISCILASQFKG